MEITNHPDGIRTAHLTEDEAQTYLLLGILTSLAAHRELTYQVKTGKKTAHGRIAGRMVQWQANAIPEDHLNEMKKLRDKLFHGLCIVSEDGMLSIDDESFDEHDPEGYLTVSLAELSGKLGMWVEG